MGPRILVLEEQPRRYLDAYEPALRALRFSEDEVQQAAGALMDVILGLMRGHLRTDPEFIRVDKRRGGFSFYLFADDVVEGIYSANPQRVYLEYVAFSFDDSVNSSQVMANIERTEAALRAA